MRTISLIRIEKEMQSIEKEPIPSVILRRQNHLNFYFCFYNLEDDFQGGFYYGLLQLPGEYPFAPPKIKFLTPNGRFEVDTFICTTFTHHHKETWTSSWNIRMILTAMISFMYCNEKGIGGIFDSPAQRKVLASKSFESNLHNAKFVSLFKEKLIELRLTTVENIEAIILNNQNKKSKSILKQIKQIGFEQNKIEMGERHFHEKQKSKSIQKLGVNDKRSHQQNGEETALEEIMVKKRKQSSNNSANIVQKMQNQQKSNQKTVPQQP